MDSIFLASHCDSTVAKMRILIIDDEPANAALLESLLLCSGYTNVKSVTDPRVAIATCREFEPDLLLLDLMMPHVDGFAVLSAVRSELGDVFLPIVILTADVSEQTKLRALRESATDFLTKPFDQTEVLIRIGNLLETRRLQQLLDNQRAAFEEAVRSSTAELRNAMQQLEEVKAHSEGRSTVASEHGTAVA